MTRRLVSLTCSLRFRSRRSCTVSQTRIAAPGLSAPLPPLRPPRRACSWTRSTRRADACTDFYQFACGGWIAKNPVPVGSRRLRPVRRAAGAQQRDAAPDPRGRGRRDATRSRRRSATTTPRASTRPAIDAKGAGAARSAAEEDRRARRASAIWRRWSPSCTRSASTCSSSSARRPTSRTRRWRWRSSIRAASVCPTATTTSGTMRSRSSCGAQYVEHVGRMSALLGAAADQAARRGAAGRWRSRPRSPKARSTPSRAAIRTRSTTRCRPPSCRR